MIVNNFLKEVAPYYLSLKNRHGVKDANEFLSDCFITNYLENEEDELNNLVLNYIKNKYYESNILGQMEEYLINNAVDVTKAETLMKLAEELI